MTSKRTPPQVAILALIGLAMIWGYNWVVMKIAVRDAAPFDFAAIRAFFGSLSLFLLMVWLRKPLKPVAIAETVVCGVLQTTGVVGLIAWALVSGGAGKTAVLNYTMPFWALILAWIFLKERLRGLQWLSVGLSLVGLVLVLLPLSLTGGLLSEALAVSAGISWAMSAIILKKINHRPAFDVLSFTTWQMLFGSIPLILVAIAIPAPPIHWTPSFIAALLYNILPGGAIAWLLWFYALNELPTGVASLGTLAIPVVGVFAAWIQLSEVPSLTEWLGIALILIALILNSMAAKNPHSATH
ncbi:DMT family transporter [Oscillatoria sp. FACHB-1407]|uniref:DMT family transporter n=1 Tax=Oscillatoria sp. FACHB-1407 TaxID=2692847 RepID=UPI0018EF791D|nr:DMT family transporter [Oscillatoria sp. FACHB-1407]